MFLGSGVADIWVNYNDLNQRPSPIDDDSKGKSSQMAELFRLVKYCNLPRDMSA